MGTKKEIAANVLKAQKTAINVENVHIISADVEKVPATLDGKKAYIRIALHLDTEVPTFRKSADGKTYERSTTNVVFTSLFDVLELLAESGFSGVIASKARTAPAWLASWLVGSVASLVVHFAEEGKEYVNPFSGESKTYSHDVALSDIYTLALDGVGAEEVNALQREIRAALVASMI